MNGIKVNRLRHFEAEAQGEQDFCRPIRMQGTAWRRSSGTLRGPAWQRALRERTLWQRSLIVGALATVGLAASGSPAWAAGGLATFLATVFVQCWQFAEQRSAEKKTRLN